MLASDCSPTRQESQFTKLQSDPVSLESCGSRCYIYIVIINYWQGLAGSQTSSLITIIRLVAVLKLELGLLKYHHQHHHHHHHHDSVLGVGLAGSQEMSRVSSLQTTPHQAPDWLLLILRTHGDKMKNESRILFYILQKCSPECCNSLMLVFSAQPSTLNFSPSLQAPWIIN